MPFNLLSEPIRKYIREKRWEQLRPIQIAAIEKIMTTDSSYILASRTASGKTEAAFLPILSKVDFNETGVQVLYISPLIALINDQFYRIEELCKNLEIPVTKWHGEANKSLKDKIIKQPKGIVLITPESIEAMFVNKPYNVRQLFSNLKFVVIDEIHSFIGTDRGVQLKSILSRLQSLANNHFRIIGLSATIGDYLQAKQFTGNEHNTKVLLDRNAREVTIEFRYFESETDELTLDLLKDLYLETKDNKVLIFPNSRGRTEEIAVKLRKISDRVKGHQNYFSHHSSVDREVREYVEFFAKSNNRQNFCISCTSTLELGIDIGAIDKVVQIDATFSVSSLIQRVGRSGRRDGEIGSLFLYATNKWSLLQSLSCCLLYQEGFIEPPVTNERPYDILLHQALSIAKSNSGVNLNDLIKQLKANFSFKQIDEEDIVLIINHLIETDLLEKLQQEIIVGVEGERVVNSRDFYSVFKTEENFKVVNSGKTIGEIPYSPQIIEDANILLAAKIWKIVFIDLDAKKIGVVSAKDGKKPLFFGSGSIVHSRIRAKMLEILIYSNNYEMLDEVSHREINKMRKDFSVFDIKNMEIDRPVLISERSIQFFTFVGTRVNRTIQLLLNISNIKHTFHDQNSLFEIEISKSEFYKNWSSAINLLSDIDSHIAKLLEETPTLLDFSKWGKHLPKKFQMQLLKNRYFDIENTHYFVSKLNFVENHIPQIKIER